MRPLYQLPVTVASRASPVPLEPGSQTCQVLSQEAVFRESPPSLLSPSLPPPPSLPSCFLSLPSLLLPSSLPCVAVSLSVLTTVPCETGVGLFHRGGAESRVAPRTHGARPAGPRPRASLSCCLQRPSELLVIWTKLFKPCLSEVVAVLRVRGQIAWPRCARLPRP